MRYTRRAGMCPAELDNTQDDLATTSEVCGTPHWRFLACFRDWRPYLGPGERATVMVIAADRKQARVIMRYVKGLLSSVPMLAQTIEGETLETISLRNRVIIEVHTASFRTTRGYTIYAALCDELAFWSDG